MGWWSANGSTDALMSNRVAGSAFGGFTQDSASTRPGVYALANGVKVASFDGVTSTMGLLITSALRRRLNRAHWAFHVRFPKLRSSLNAIWAEWGNTERFRVLYSPTGVQVQVATSSIAFSTSAFDIPAATMEAGFWLEVIFDGDAVDPLRRVRVFADSAEMPLASQTSDPPTALLAGTASSVWLAGTNGSAIGAVDHAHVYFSEGVPSVAERAAMRLVEAPQWETPFASPTDVPAVVAWLRTTLATVTAEGVSSVPDALNANPAVQATTTKRPQAVLSSNGLQCLRFEAGDHMTWPMLPALNSPDHFGIGFWMKPAQVTGWQGVVTLAVVHPAGVHRVKIVQQSVGMTMEVFPAGSTGAGRYGYAAACGLSLTAWTFVTLEYDNAPYRGTAESNRVTITASGTSRSIGFGNQGAGAAMAQLNSFSGNVIIGDQKESVPLLQWIGTLGPNLFVFGKEAGAVRGLLRPITRQHLMQYTAPT